MNNTAPLVPAMATMMSPRPLQPIGQLQPDAPTRITNMGNSTAIPSFALGGQIGPGGVPIRPGGNSGLALPGGQAPQKMTMQEVDQEASRFVQQHPQEAAKITAEIQQAIQSGEITTEELAAVVQLATVALQNPAMYPQLVAAAVKSGMLEEGDFPAEYDQGFLFVVYLIGKSMTGQGGEAPPQRPGISMKDGGALPERSPSPDGVIPVNAHEGEYVIPAAVVRAKGTDFFDKLVQPTNEKPAG